VKHYLPDGKELREAPGGGDPTEIYPVDGYGRLTIGDPDTYEMYVKDHLGSTAVLYNINSHGESYSTDYEPYGKLRGDTTYDSFALSLTPEFTGKEPDSGLDLDYFGARYYDADFGVWTSPDPDGQYFSPYTYCDRPGELFGSQWERRRTYSYGSI
jgi:RHS repeat-associated protein